MTKLVIHKRILLSGYNAKSFVSFFFFFFETKQLKKKFFKIWKFFFLYLASDSTVCRLPEFCFNVTSNSHQIRLLIGLVTNISSVKAIMYDNTKVPSAIYNCKTVLLHAAHQVLFCFLQSNNALNSLFTCIKSINPF